MNEEPIRFSRRRFAVGAFGLGLSGGVVQTHASAAAIPIVNAPKPLRDPGEYDAYIPTASKTGPFFEYTCEFDAAWAVLKTFGINASLEEQLAAIKIDRRVEPYHQETPEGFVVYGGDISTAYSGDYATNFLARTTGPAMKRVFTHFGLRATEVNSRKRMEEQLRAGRLVWIKMTVDFKDWVPITWITPDGVKLNGVLGNDHAMVVIGYNEDVVVVRDVLGPTSTNWERPYEVEVSWERFLTCWRAQNNDGLAVGRRESN